MRPPFRTWIELASSDLRFLLCAHGQNEAETCPENMIRSLRRVSREWMVAFDRWLAPIDERADRARVALAWRQATNADASLTDAEIFEDIARFENMYRWENDDI